MKKLISLFMLLILSISMVACGDNDKGSGPKRRVPCSEPSGICVEKGA